MVSASTASVLWVMLSAYWSCLSLRKRFRWAWLNPVLFTTVISILYLQTFDIPYETFKPSGDILAFWLQAAVVCLALPLYRQWPRIRQQWLPILTMQVGGSLVGIISGVLLARLLGAPDLIAWSLAAKSVTMPIALDITQNINAIPPLVAAGVVLAGMTGQTLGFYFLQRCGQSSPMAQGLAMGTASHAMGIAACLEHGSKYAAYATLGLIFNGILTALFTPVLAGLSAHLF